MNASTSAAKHPVDRSSSGGKISCRFNERKIDGSYHLQHTSQLSRLTSFSLDFQTFNAVVTHEEISVR
jgi:hypothetical protein